MTTLVRLSDVTAKDIVEPQSDSLQRGVISIGNFDGVHEGHAALLSIVRRKADEVGGPAVAVVLDPHPAAILRPEFAPQTLTWMERRAELMDRVGIDFMAVCNTTKEFLNLTANDFFDRLVVDRLQAKAMVEGPNFFFGRGREGSVNTLGKLCEKTGIDLTIAQSAVEGDKMISSTRIRGLLQAGEVDSAVNMLGMPYQIRGTVAHGLQRGRQLGFPTANLESIDGIVPGLGVYGGKASVEGQQPSFLAAIHIGPNPTFESDGQTKTEIHLIDFKGDLYGRVLRVDFVTCLRDVARFESADALKVQLHADVQAVRDRLGSES